MLSIAWIVLAVVATMRGAGWKPWIVVAAGLAFVFVSGFMMGGIGMRPSAAEDALLVVGFVAELCILLGVIYFAINPQAFRRE